MVDRTEPLFQLGTVYKAPATIVDSGEIYIHGREWGPDNKFMKGAHKGWVYVCREVLKKPAKCKEGYITPLGEHFWVSESEVEKWNPGSSPATPS